ncbi:hypothetical protein CDL12_25022 [Handroanthus impetiginosus]|uniref:Remorin C-terminal domain-containing protein n=1 Tax=Handroanthus impetiginosus TaxID=429701 RepID=A0A2G9GB01_9LAMI|nr:hypothetical protein CDL12_25022 [Handroanthus impetiginosus]
MEYLIKQTRQRFSGTRQDNKDESSSTRDRKIPPQKTQSSSEKSRSQSWIRRQFSRQMSRDYDLNGSDYATAVAAAAYAIQSLEESKSKDQKEKTYGPDKSLNKMKSKVDDTGVPPERLKSALKSSTSSKDPAKKLPASTSKKIPEKVPSMKKKISFADIDEDRPEKSPIGKVSERAPSMKGPQTSTDKQLNVTDSKEPKTTMPKADRLPTGPSTSVPKPGPESSKADTWEKQEMANIKERFEKLRATIDNWETKKKKRAKRKLERIEAELDKRRVKALQSYNSKIKRVEGIAGGAREQNEENRRNEEFKAREKANKIRSTGKLPATCLCF